MRCCDILVRLVVHQLSCCQAPTPEAQWCISTESDTGRVCPDQHASALDQHASALDQHASALDQHASALDQHASALDKHASALYQHASALDQHASALDQHASYFITCSSSSNNTTYSQCCNRWNNAWEPACPLYATHIKRQARHMTIKTYLVCTLEHLFHSLSHPYQQWRCRLKQQLWGGS